MIILTSNSYKAPTVHQAKRYKTDTRIMASLWVNRDSERFSNVPRATQQASSRARITAQTPHDGFAREASPACKEQEEAASDPSL